MPYIMVNYKKNVREINKAKNKFVKWLNDNHGDNIDNDTPIVDEEWDYYCVISGFIGDCLYTVSFMVWRGNLKIEYSDDFNRYTYTSVHDFLQLID